MYQCTSCNGGLKFDITSQQLMCEYCGNQYDPYEMDGLIPATEDNTMEVTLYTCAQCGGELYATDNAITSSCSFCGSKAVINSRISKELRPDYLIPFKKTKADCKEAYTKMMRAAVFAPKELKDPSAIDGFRGIYMPYWMYDVDHTGRASFIGKKSYREGDYILTDNYQFECDARIFYNGMYLDGSASFADNISEKVAPFDVHELKKFTPAFMSGFYADTADVDEKVYRSDIENKAIDRSEKFIKKDKEVRSYEIADNAIAMNFRNRIQNVHRAMFPVWFMSYQKNGRVSYAVVNGQSGKVVADTPVDIKKYLLGTVLLALPIFVLLNMFLTLIPKVLVCITSIIALIVSILHTCELNSIMKKETGQDDKGLMSKKNIKFSDRETDRVLQNFYKKKKTTSMLLLILGIFVVVNIIPAFLALLSVMYELGMSALNVSGHAVGLLPIIMMFALIGCIVSIVFGNRYMKKMESGGFVHSLWCVIAVSLAMIVVVLNPVKDLYYYIVAIVAMGSVVFTLVDLIKKYNILATRKLPQFEYKGGDDGAY